MSYPPSCALRQYSGWPLIRNSPPAGGANLISYLTKRASFAALRVCFTYLRGGGRGGAGAEVRRGTGTGEKTAGKKARRRPAGARREERMIGPAPVVHEWFDELVADLSIAEHTLV
jgi:hypothetical protein